ncbi:hypothetical protein [Ornithinimicrobium murale]|uniref:hypothetical protein n=1 Tax=Ornithinimicrobium murale TaxID=1050153 RepID=UPI000E0D6326|nr:hypothetical protein [Ornithinimicrobium murale]
MSGAQQTCGRGARSWHPAHLALGGLAVLVALGLVLASLNRGFDWTDEAFVYTMIASDRLAVGEAWGFQHLLHPVFEAVGERVLVFRVLRLVGYLALAGVLTWTAGRVLARLGRPLARREWWLVLLLAQAGTLLAWSYPPRYLGYNELSSWLGQLLCACLALGLVPAPGPPRRRLLVWLVAGLLLPPLVIAKFTTGVGWVPLLLLAVAVPVPGCSRRLRGLTVLAGMVLGLALLVACGVPVVDTVRQATGLLVDVRAQEVTDHSVPVVLGTYLWATLRTACALSVPLALLAVLALLVLRPAGRRVVALAWLLPVVVVLGLLLSPASGSWDTLGVLSAFLGSGGVLGLALVRWRGVRSPDRSALSGQRPPQSPGPVLVVGLALATPLLAAAGTNNGIWGQTLFATTVWAVLLGTALCLLSRAADPVVRGAPVLLGGLVLVLTAGHVAGDVLIHPYRTTPYLSQGAPTSVPQLSGIRMEQQQTQEADWLAAVAREQGAAGVPAVAIASPGHLFVFNRSGWASPWRGTSWASSVVEACRTHPPEELFVVDPGAAVPGAAEDRELLRTALGTCDLAFPDDFRVVAQRAETVVWRWGSTASGGLGAADGLLDRGAGALQVVGRR